MPEKSYPVTSTHAVCAVDDVNDANVALPAS
jgi:hypothetical protein